MDLDLITLFIMKKDIKEYIIKPGESQFEEWEEITFNFYKNWLESEAE